MLKSFTAAVLGLAAAGCASIETRPSQGPGGGTGLAYMAPIRHLTVTATRAQGADAAAATAAEAARTAYIKAVNAAAPLEAAKATLVAEATAARRLYRAADDASATTAKPALLRAAELAETRAAVAKAQSTAAEGAVDATKRTYERALNAAASVGGGWQETIDIAMGPAVGDRRARFAARVKDSAFRSISGAISAPNGLLQSSNVALTGAGEPVLIGLAQSLVSFASPGRAALSQARITPNFINRPTSDPAAPPAVIGLVAACSPTGALAGPLTGSPKPETYTRTFDPTDRRQVQEVNFALCRLGFSYRVRPDVDDAEIKVVDANAQEAPPAAQLPPEDAALPKSWREVTAAEAPPAPALGGCETECDGLVYRQNEPLMINIVKVETSCAVTQKANETCVGFDNQRGYIARSFAVNIPNRSPLYVMPYGSAVFVTRTDNVGFDSGTLVSLDYNHPSEAAVAAGIPFRVLNAVTTAVSSIVQLRIDLTGKQTELTEAQRALADAQATPGGAEVAQLENAKKVLQLQQEIAELQAQLLQAQSGQQDGN